MFYMQIKSKVNDLRKRLPNCTISSRAERRSGRDSVRNAPNRISLMYSPSHQISFPKIKPLRDRPAEAQKSDSQYLRNRWGSCAIIFRARKNLWTLTLIDWTDRSLLRGQTWNRKCKCALKNKAKDAFHRVHSSISALI